MGLFDDTLVSPDRALPGRTDQRMTVPEAHEVNGHPLVGPWPAGMEQIVLGMGCFWGAEEIYWQVPGVYTTAVGYAGGFTPNPTYQETCTGMTGHTEVTMVVYDPAVVPLQRLLEIFWEQHDPTQGFRQGNDMGSQYRSAVYTSNAEQAAVVQATAQHYQQRLAAAGRGTITTEIAPLDTFYYAEPIHQQYLAKNPHGYRCHAATGVPYA
ncbi:MAG TPA: peptide-methionine (S)-S-oxide reductase MsrA [Ilumatobacteraceae bacterium]|nr:peptide-methionine (S)-S-oxide reductase MsrA [Ilumatobacteraceae bacterium]